MDKGVFFLFQLSSISQSDGILMVFELDNHPLCNFVTHIHIESQYNCQIVFSCLCTLVRPENCELC